jgi:hypothetical protein
MIPQLLLALTVAAAPALVAPAPLAAAREVIVEAVDATGRSSEPARAALACPGDGSLGDSFCALGDLLARLPGLPGRARARLERDAQAAARAMDRAGTTTSGSAARRFLRRVERRLARFARRARAVRADPGAVAALAADAQSLRDRVRVLSQTFTPA